MLTVHLLVGAVVVALVHSRVSRETRLALRARWCRRVLRVLCVDLEVFGTPPSGCHLIAANHISWLDAFVIGAVFPCWFVAKSEVRAWPLAGWMAAANDTLFLRRRSARAVYRMNADIRELLDSQQAVVFPEGTTTDGSRVPNFFPALFQPATDWAVPVQPSRRLLSRRRPTRRACGCVYRRRSAVEIAAYGARRTPYRSMPRAGRNSRAGRTGAARSRKGSVCGGPPCARQLGRRRGR